MMKADELSGTGETDRTWKEVSKRFISPSPDENRRISDNEFRCKGIVRLMAFFRPGMFRKETLRDVKQFKEFAGNECRG